MLNNKDRRMTLPPATDPASGQDALGQLAFWQALDEAQALLGRGGAGRAEAAGLLARLARRLNEAAEDLDAADLDAEVIAGRRAALARVAAHHGLEPAEAPADMAGLRRALDPEAAPPAPAEDPEFDPAALKTWVREVLPGTALVTCCKNRNENLLRALPSWLAQDGIAQIVIVDWSSDVPVAQSLAEAGIGDPRILLARVEDEPHWVLSYAFNVGFRLARHARIVKADADIVLAPDFLARNPLAAGSFIAGNWRAAGRGQEFVNGFFMAGRADLMAIKGFNEYITTYGWDDDDLYTRLTASGLLRRDVAPGTVRHLDHDDAARLEGGGRQVSAWAELQTLPMFKTRTNRFIATMMPGWDGWRVMVPYAVRETGPGRLQLVRSEPPRHRVPDHMRATAERLAAYELLSWRASLRVFDLTPEALQLLLRRKHLSDITALHVDLMLAGADMGVVTAPRFLVADLADPVATGPVAALLALADRLAARAAELGRQLVLRAPVNDLADRLARLRAAGLAAIVLPAHGHLSPLRDMAEDELATDPVTPILRIEITTLPDLAAPGLARPRDRIFIDAQHGLGNRLRAIGSAAAIARATGREMVVVWQPDHHCDGRMSDLFDHDGAVIEESFAEEAGRQGATVLSYMEIEPGATKDAPLHLVAGRDAYVRSAFVINHPASTWDSENVLLQALRPNQAVRALMAGVPDHRDIGLHIRMEGAPGTDTNSYDRAENWSAQSHEAINLWRGKSHYSRFLKRLEGLLAEAPEAKLFLAADLPETYAAFAQSYGPRVAWLERAVYDRSAVQLQYALADILLLARCETFLGSNWSSFSEVALRMSVTVRHHEMSGIDF